MFFTQAIDITTEVSVEKFNAIAAAVLKQGDRKTYCNRYNNSPHYQMDGFDLYLNPANQFTNWSADKLSAEVSDYNTIVLYDQSAQSVYYDLLLKGDNVFLTCSDQTACLRIKKIFLTTYLPQIERVFQLDNVK
ncbi:hypothetical protein [Cytophaga hutchinsonii]|uniref:Uncharacterized protein n=1 Tax=Cytophaga hutchinsonii (strain ATCC 33406 / DSM 1761 / CIP 103989 / NBRC 15051 / NCIMB 9469 / D465) TaxID=269798 RepID=A0A6N4SQ34_CYTH3|nr:hypothetical protein [Cytophaga hutchinsonii]ABG58394.1 hypothetical protein CHU_1119 [Cytophaga hutchinsonii ATCC 33406]SFX51057.1 hypothetical protein SAMN04487930_10537 [Cytophaga hutchinsonii ATCC 33406]